MDPDPLVPGRDLFRKKLRGNKHGNKQEPNTGRRSSEASEIGWTPTPSNLVSDPLVPSLVPQIDLFGSGTPRKKESAWRAETRKDPHPRGWGPARPGHLPDLVEGRITAEVHDASPVSPTDLRDAHRAVTVGGHE